MKATLVETPPKEEEGGRGGLQEDRSKRRASFFQNHLELRLGISLNSGPEVATTSTRDGKGGAVGPSPGFPASPEGLLLHQSTGAVPAGWANGWVSEVETSLSFVHPWSLAARQQKAAFEKAHQKPNSCSTVPRVTPPPLPPIVGWPPVRAFRRNIVGLHVPKTEMNGEKEAKKAKITEGNDGIKASEVKSTMFVKVNMEGYTVGRKIDLKVHDSYESLSRTLQRMFNNFLSTNYCKKIEQDEEVNVPASNYLLIYEDHEGDRMLVGDVPWEMFITSVKRLYIANSPRANMNVDGRVAEDEN